MVSGMNGATAQAHTATSSGPFSKASFAHSFSPRDNATPGAIRSITLRGPAGRLEAILNLGAHDAPFAALVCHPHPVFGGTFHNKVVYRAMKMLNDARHGLGWPVLRFNFRGAGLSEGVHDGIAEVDDVLAALDWLDGEFDRPVVIAGFSFGAAMALRACSVRADERSNRPRIRAAIALGLPAKAEERVYDYAFLDQLRIPKLFLSGDRDAFASPAQLRQITASAAEPTRLEILSGADHFFTGQLETMQERMKIWLTEQLQ